MNTEEQEIKIEYYDSNLTTDPLSEMIQQELNEGLKLNCTNESSLIYQDVVYESEEKISSETTTWQKSIDELGRLLCKFCNHTYSTIQTLRFHVKRKHPDKANNFKHIVKNKRNKKLKCHICKKRFKLLENLKDHVQLSHNIDSLHLSCHVCNATFNDQKMLIEHYYHKHKGTNIKKYFCTTCGYRTTKKSHFNQHKNTHDYVKKSKCNHCDYATNYPPNLKIHQQIHSDVKPFRCSFNGCMYCCSTMSALRSHQLTHNRDENMLLCDQCSYKTVYKQSLRKHIDSHKRNSIKMK